MPIPKDKRKFALWLYPETLDKIGQLYTTDDCRSKSEFIEKAVQFYIDHLTAEDQRSMLPNAMLSSMKSIVAESDNRICRLLFKMAVELAVTMNVVAANSDIDDVSLERLKGECVLQRSKGRKDLRFSCQFGYRCFEYGICRVLQRKRCDHKCSEDRDEQLHGRRNKQ